MKRALVLFWHGLTGILVGVANWFTVVLGMKDESKYGRLVRRVVATCFALIMIMLASATIYAIGKAFYEELPCNVRYGDDYYDSQYISHNVTYYNKTYWDEEGYIKTRDGKKAIKGIYWIAKPLGRDSLVCYSDGKKRGYFNMFTGKPVIKPQYDHAWIFSEGLASVDDNGWIKFIDTTGKVVIDLRIPYTSGAEGYVFHNSHCAVHNNRRDRIGLIDKQGNWILKPEYFSIEPKDTFWIVSNGREKSVITDNMETVIPFMAGSFWIYEGVIFATMADHSIRRYTLKGELIEDFYINSIDYLTYEKPELRYVKTRNYDGEGHLVSETDDANTYHVQATAKCKRYEAETGWYGLMTSEGKIITPPSYSNIIAVDYDMYLCKDNSEDGVLLNGKGQRVR